MKVLWFSCSSACYDKAKHGSWIEALEIIVQKNLKEISLGIAFQHEDNIFKVEKNGVVYYPIHPPLSFIEKVKSKLLFSRYDNFLVKEYKRIVDDFHPDLIQCFGTEWPYGLITKCTDKPVVIHMMGNRNCISYSKKQVVHKSDNLLDNIFRPWNILKSIYYWKGEKYEDMREKVVFSLNRYFMGRTSWDNDIVRYFSPDSLYFHCEEAIREEIFNNPHRWKFTFSDKPRFITVANPSVLKGNTQILETANILKKEFGLDFEWRVTCSENDYRIFEKMTGINYRDVGIKMIGRINANEIARELAEAQIYIHISIIDNSPNSLCEAQLMGTPVIASNVGGISDLVEDGKTGILFPYNEPYTLAFRIMDLLNNKERLEQLSLAEIEVSHNRHNPDLIGETLYNIYNKVLEDDKRII